MRCACDNVLRMARMIQIRNVPDPVHRTLKSRAAQAGMTLSDYLRAEVQELAELPTVAALTERIRQRTPARIKGSTAPVIRRHRDAR
jgi:plasmid stability protein